MDATQSGPLSGPGTEPPPWSESCASGMTHDTAGRTTLPDGLGFGHGLAVEPAMSQSTLVSGHETQLFVQLNLFLFGHSFLSWRTAATASNAFHIWPPSYGNVGT